MENFVFALVMASISGITFIAYKHPIGYKKVYIPLYFINFLVYSVLMSWSISVSYFWGKVYEHLTQEQIDLVKPILDRAELPLLEINLIFFGLVIYLTLLNFLPNLVEKNET